MITRPLTSADIPRIRELQCGYEWPISLDEQGNPAADFMGGCGVEKDGKLVAASGFWLRAEAHMVIDPAYGTPEDRLALIGQMHEEIAPQLKSAGIGQVWTFFGVLEAFCRRLKAFHWQPITHLVWGRIIS